MGREVRDFNRGADPPAAIEARDLERPAKVPGRNHRNFQRLVTEARYFSGRGQETAEHWRKEITAVTATRGGNPSRR